MALCIWGFDCKECWKIELLCVPCTRARQFCAQCLHRRRRAQMQKAGKDYRRTERGREANRLRQARRRRARGGAMRARGAQRSPEPASPSPPADGAAPPANTVVPADALAPPTSTPVAPATPAGVAPTTGAARNASVTVILPHESRRVVAEPTDLATAVSTPSGAGERSDAGTTIGGMVASYTQFEGARRRGEHPTHGCCARCGRAGELMYFDGRLAIVRPGADRAAETG